MRIKLAILERDQSYLSRIVSVFNTKYADKFEIYSFTDRDIALTTLDTARIDVLVASDAYDIDAATLPRRCGFAYLVDSVDIDHYNEQRAICKFQKVDLIYKQILSVYSEKAGSVSGIKLGDESAKIIAFCSPSGGAGSSTMAAAAAVNYASKGKKTLYLNLEKFGSSDSFFAGEGQFDMSDIVFALKSKKTNLPLKLESCVKQDNSGVFFYSQSKVALDMHEISVDDVLRLISEITLTGAYDHIVLDLDFALDSNALKVLRQTHAIVWVGDGSEISNTKICRAFNALTILEQNNDSPLTNRVCLAYNKFSNKSSKTVGEIGIKNIGGAPRYEHASTAQVIEQLSKLDFFGKVF